jgi:uncharacterized membrane protein
VKGVNLTRVEKSIEINASLGKVWAMVQWEKLPEWHTEFKKVEYTSKDKAKVGSTLHMIGEVAGMKSEADLEITEVIENEKESWRSTSGNMTGFGFIALSPTEAGTKVTQVIDYELPYSVLGKLIDKLRVHKAMDKSYDIALKKLKDIMEK